MSGRILATSRVMGEAALCAGSFLFQRMVRAALLLAYTAASRRGKRPPQWQVLSRDLLKHPLALPLIMTRAPRWNTHAIIANLGPVEVGESIAVDRAAADGSVAAWTIVVSAFPPWQPVASLGSWSAATEGRWETVRLPAGRYSLGLRYYEGSERMELPAVRVDGRETVAAMPLEREVNRFYERLGERSNLFYRALGYYLYGVLRWRHRLPSRFVEREILPAGNPETQFRYGALNRGESLRIEIDPSLLPAFGVYLTLYGRDSFPVLSQRIESREHTTPAAQAPGYYLVRVHPRTARPGSFPEAGLVAVVLPSRAVA